MSDPIGFIVGLVFGAVVSGVTFAVVLGRRNRELFKGWDEEHKRFIAFLEDAERRGYIDHQGGWIEQPRATVTTEHVVEHVVEVETVEES